VSVDGARVTDIRKLIAAVAVVVLGLAACSSGSDSKSSSPATTSAPATTPPPFTVPSSTSGLWPAAQEDAWWESFKRSNSNPSGVSAFDDSDRDCVLRVMEHFWPVPAAERVDFNQRFDKKYDGRSFYDIVVSQILVTCGGHP
jgi:hypothetical protein